MDCFNDGGAGVDKYPHIKANYEAVGIPGMFFGRYTYLKAFVV